MLGNGKDNLVVRSNIHLSPGGSDKIDALCCSTRKDNLQRVLGSNKVADRRTCSFVSLKGSLSERVQIGCRIGIVASVELGYSIDDLSRTLCRGSGIEVNELCVIDALSKYGKL